LRGNIPSFIFISDGKLHDVNILDQLVPEPGAIYVMDRGYIDFDRLGRFHETGSFFVIRPGNAACGWQVWRHHVQTPYYLRRGEGKATGVSRRTPTPSDWWIMSRRGIGRRSPSWLLWVGTA
jgi:hypothetical protein